MTVTLTLPPKTVAQTPAASRNVVVPLHRTLYERIVDFVNEMKKSNLVLHQGLDLFLHQFQANPQDAKSVAWLFCFLLSDVVEVASCNEEDQHKLETLQQFEDRIPEFLKELMPQGGVQELIDAYEVYKIELAGKKQRIANAQNSANQALTTLGDAYKKVDHELVDDFRMLLKRVQILNDKAMNLNERDRKIWDDLNAALNSANRDLQELILQGKDITRMIVGAQADIEKTLHSFENMLKGAK